MSDQVFKGFLVHLTASETIPAATPAGMTSDDQRELAVRRLVTAFANTFAKEFTTFSTQKSGEIIVGMKLTLMLPSVPKGFATTPIVFKELPPCPSVPAAGEPASPAPSTPTPTSPSPSAASA